MSQSERIRSPPARRYIPDLVSASTRTSPTRAYDRQEAYVQLAAMGEANAAASRRPRVGPGRPQGTNPRGLSIPWLACIHSFA